MIADQCDYQVFLADAMPTDGYGCGFGDYRRLSIIEALSHNDFNRKVLGCILIVHFKNSPMSIIKLST